MVSLAGNTPGASPRSRVRTSNAVNILRAGIAALALSACAVDRIGSNIGSVGKPLQDATEFATGKAGQGTKWAMHRLADGTVLIGDGLGWTIRRLGDGTEVLVSAAGIVLGYGVNGIFKLLGGAADVTVFIVRNLAEGTVTIATELGGRAWDGLGSLSLPSLGLGGILGEWPKTERDFANDPNPDRTYVDDGHASKTYAAAPARPRAPTTVNTASRPGAPAPASLASGAPTVTTLRPTQSPAPETPRLKFYTNGDELRKRDPRYANR